MRAASCSYRSNKLLFFLLLFSLTLTQCRAEEIAGMPLSDLSGALERGDASFLGRLGTERAALTQVRRLGPAAPYYLSFWSEELGLPAQARALRELEWDEGRGWWREEAALALLSSLASAGEWAEAERQGLRFLPRLRIPRLRERCQRAVAAALYWQRKDAELLPLLARLDDGRDDELLLFRSAASCRLAAPGWPDSFRELFFRRPVSGLHLRAFSFLQLEGRLESFDGMEALFFGAKAALAEGRPADALAVLEQSLPRLGSERLTGTPIVAEAAAAFLQAGEYARGVRLIASLPAGDEGAEWAGRLARRDGATQDAERFFRQVLARSTDFARRDRAAWFLLDLARARDGRAFLQEVGRQAAGWAAPEYFADILDREISGLTARRRWDQLVELRGLLAGVQGPGAEAVRARLAYLEGRLGSLGLLPLGRLPRASEPLEGYRAAVRLDPGGYYGWLAAALLPEAERPAFRPQVEGAPVAEVFDDPEPAQRGPAEQVPPEAFLLGFFEYGLYRTGFERVQAERAGLDPRILRKAAQELARRGQVLLSLRLLNRYLAADSVTPDLEALRLYYPQAYRSEVEELSRTEDIPPALFFALIREESHFDPLIVSSAGAVGLTQMLPETAQDMARLLRIGAPDLRDPRQNLRLGARHLGRLLGRLEDVPKALIAYNAGLGRLRQWEKSFAGLPADLLVEAAPFDETRGYLRKVLVSAVHYGYLYYDLTPASVVRLFFPEAR